MSEILNFILSFILMCIMGILCAFLFILDNYKQISTILQEKNKKGEQNGRY